MRRLLFPLCLGLAGCALLVALGLWQLARLDWKEALIAEIETRLVEAPVPLPAPADPAVDRFRPVTAAGEVVGRPLTVLVSAPGIGPAFRLIAPFRTTDDRRILVDLGVIPADGVVPGIEARPVTVTGNLHWPEETNLFTPEPEGELWFVRDVEAMSGVLGTERLMVVARETAPELPVTPWPIDVTGIPNNHREYAITWFGIAVAWAAMSVLWMIRRRRGL